MGRACSTRRPAIRGLRFRPWFGARLAAYRTAWFSGGAYVGYRTDFRDIAVGVDAFKDHWPWPKTQVGFNAERSLGVIGPGGTPAERAALYGRYVFDDTDSLYQAPIHYAEMFTAFQNHFLPHLREPEVDAERYKDLFNFGVHYHLNLLTPYWDPERGFQLDTSIAQGFEVFRNQEATQQANMQLSMIRRLPDGFGWLSRTRIALRAYGAVAQPNRALLYSLGGSELFRGFDLAQRQGSAVWVGSAEWRVPLTRKLDYQIWERMANLKKVYAIGFYDVGSAYVGGHQVDNIAHAVGEALRVDIAWFSFLERTIFRIDVAKAVNVNTPVQYWFGMEHPF